LGPWDVLLQVRDAGIPVVVLPAKRSLRGIAGFTRQVAAALGVPDAGRLLAQRTTREVAEVERQVAAVAPTDPSARLRTVFLYVRGKSGVYYMFGEGSGADSLIGSLGLYDVSKEIGWKGMRPVTDEGIVAAQPEVILMMTKGLASVGGVDGLLDRLPALAQTPAGQQRRIVDMDDSQVLGFGPLSAQVLNALAVAVYAPASVR
jgi:iron complex transport system substrate-binding protein